MLLGYELCSGLITAETSSCPASSDDMESFFFFNFLPLIYLTQVVNKPRDRPIYLVNFLSVFACFTCVFVYVFVCVYLCFFRVFAYVSMCVRVYVCMNGCVFTCLCTYVYYYSLSICTYGEVALHLWSSFC